MYEGPLWTLKTHFPPAVAQLQGNAFSGTLPAPWSLLTALISARLDGNALTGTLPVAYSALHNLVTLNLKTNALSSTVPPSWAAQLTRLTRLDVSANPLMCGSAPAPWALGGSPILATGTGMGSACA